MPRDGRKPEKKDTRTTPPRGKDVDFYSNATLKLDRRHMLWFNKHYSKVTSKGNIVGWYLDGPAHEPFWHNRKTKYIRNPTRKTHHISSNVKQQYKTVRLGKISTDLFLTAGELKTLKAMFEDTPEIAPAPPQQPKPRLNSKEQVHLQNILNNIQNPGRLPTPPREGEVVEPKADDAAAAYEEHRSRMEAARSGRLRKMGRNAMAGEKEEDGFEEMWQGPWEDRWLEGS